MREAAWGAQNKMEKLAQRRWMTSRRLLGMGDGGFN